MNPQNVIHNVTTGEIVKIEMTDEEVAERDKLAQEQERQEAQAEIARNQALAKLAAIGLTPQDLTALGLTV